jgi:hypothetical protein
MTKPVGVDADGRLWVAPIGGGSGGGDTPVVPGTHGIIWDLVNVTSSNNVTSVSDGASLIAVLTPASGYTLGTVTVTMGGEVLTGVWNADTAIVTIPSVTGDVVISCTGVENVTVDTSPVIVEYNVGLTTTGDITKCDGQCITKRYEYTQDITSLQANKYYDSENGYITNNNVFGSIYMVRPKAKWRELYPNAVGAGNSDKCILRAGEEFLKYSSGSTAFGVANDARALGTLSIQITLYEADIDDSYAYWKVGNAAVQPVFPLGVREGDIIFAGKNTEYYGMANIDGTLVGEEASAISLDEDVAQDYSIATTSILGEDVSANPSYTYGLASDFASVIEEARNAWMIEYGGDYRKIPIIVTTDQHGRTNSGIFNMIGLTCSMHDISKVMNLGDTLATDWYDADEAHPLLSNAQLEKWCESVRKIPFSKQLNVFGNHDCCYGNYSDEGNPIGTRYPNSKAHLYQYFRNIYARRTNNHGWFSVKDDAFNVKYVVYSLYQWPNGLDNSNAIHTEQMEWFIDELKADDGYDIVIVAHEPFNLNCTTANYPTNGTLQDVTWQRGIALESVINARMNKTSGTTTDASGVSHTFDFSGCTSALLCSLHGHTHEDQYAYTEGGMLQNTFDWFANNTIFFALIDRVNRVLNIWKVEGDALTYTNYQVPLDKPTE